MPGASVLTDLAPIRGAWSWRASASWVGGSAKRGSIQGETDASNLRAPAALRQRPPTEGSGITHRVGGLAGTRNIGPRSKFWIRGPLCSCAPSGDGAFLLRSLRHDRLEQDPGRAGPLHEVIPDPVELHAGDLPGRAARPGGELRREQEEPGRQGEVDRLSPEHAPEIRRVASHPVGVGEPSNEELVARRRVEVDDRELARPIDRKEVDLAAGRAGNPGVDDPQARLERSREFSQGRPDLLPRDLG